MDMGKVVHFEVPADDVARAKEFYGSIFGWDITTMQMAGGEYTSVVTSPVDEKTRMPTEPGSINGGMVQRSADTPGPVITIEVDGIDDALKKVEAAGGSIVQPRTAIPDMGAYAYFKDSEGNVMGLWENA
jgi:predicted enzyme related to lactoylglutathione lyase